VKLDKVFSTKRWRQGFRRESIPSQISQLIRKIFEASRRKVHSIFLGVTTTIEIEKSKTIHHCEGIRFQVYMLLGYFQNSNTHQFTWFGNLPTPRSYWFVLIKLRNNTNNKTRRRRKSSLLNSSSLSLTFFSLCFHSSLCSSRFNTPALH
jgi:hypothetical protein